MNPKPIYFPGLAGIRGISALLVVLSHASSSFYARGLQPFIVGKLPLGMAPGRQAVTVFFVLSGFLITYLLQVEKDTGTINIKKFYLRRILRIWPLYYLYLATAIITLLYFGLPIAFKDVMYYVLFIPNIAAIQNVTIKLVAHYWSLGLEEQFYLFWPVINKTTKNLLKLSIIIIVSVFLIKLLAHRYNYPNVNYDLDIMRFDCMLIGAVAALLYKSNDQMFLSFADNKITQAICWTVLFLVFINKYNIAPLDHEGISVVAALIIVGQIKIKNRLINLEVPILQYLGKLSYGVYIIHFIVIFFLNKYLDVSQIPSPFNGFVVYLSVFSTSILLAHLSYKYYESYFLRKKNKFEVVKSSSTPV